MGNILVKEMKMDLLKILYDEESIVYLEKLFGHELQSLSFLLQLKRDFWEKARVLSRDVRNVVIEDGADIPKSCEIQGPVIIRKDAVLRPNSYIRPFSYIGENCVVGHGSEVKNTIMLPGSKIGSFVFCGDSFLGSGARVGSGTILSNRKFDQTEIIIKKESGLIKTGEEKLGAFLGDYSRLGANCSTAPGTVLGKYSWVATGLEVKGIIKPKKYVKPLSAPYEVVDNKGVKKLDLKDKSGKM